MKSLFVRSSRIWFAVMAAGVVLVAAGLFQIASGIRDIYGGTGAAPQVAGDPVNQQYSPDREAIDSVGRADLPEKKSSEAKEGQQKNQFFVEYRLDRDRTRSQQIDLMREIVNNQNSSDEARSEAQRRLLAISQDIETEMKLEHLIKAEGFKDAVVFAQEKSATVIVQTPALTEIDEKRVVGMVGRLTGLKEGDITVISKM